ncbi:hypothetical protein [Noviherbaspirillum soli]|uniref:hypothetical protein n=1 Tax=Noviherbaspirillum soli TaxID=1064518 RepID=UPI00188AA699|nr:hypothetical protein [Noviherbaspirillum soli]
MHDRTALLGCFALSGMLLLGACGERAAGNRSEARQTNFPGQLAAGSKSSGEIMERSREATKSQMPSGTPGIPEGAGGNTSGPAMGGTSPGAAVAGDAPKGKMAGETPAAGPAASAAQPSAAEQAAARAQKEKQELAASMDEVARRWRADAAKNGWKTYPAVGHDAVAGITASGAQEQTRAVPPPVHSEKSGSAAPSEDVKKPKEPGAK